MGAMGRYIDAITESGRDRVIQAPGWTEGWEFRDQDGCGCLCGNAEGWGDGGCAELFQGSDFWPLRETVTGYRNQAPYVVYPRAVARFGLDRVVRAIKLRAARLNGCSPEQIAALISTPTPRPAELTQA